MSGAACWQGSICHLAGDNEAASVAAVCPVPRLEWGEGVAVSCPFPAPRCALTSELPASPPGEGLR